MSEDHCLDETDAFGDRGCDDGGSGGNERGGEKEGTETAFEEMELAIEEICNPGSRGISARRGNGVVERQEGGFLRGNEARRKAVNGKEQTELGDDELGLPAD